MQKLNDLSRSLTSLEPDGTLQRAQQRICGLTRFKARVAPLADRE